MAANYACSASTKPLPTTTRWAIGEVLGTKQPSIADVLQFSAMPSPRFYGSHTEPETGAAWLVIEYVADAVRVADMISPGRALRRAARWIGRFHADTETRLACVPMALLRTYDGEYYLQWARRTEPFAGELRVGGSWLTALCGRFAASVKALLASPPIVIHGEYGPKNILARGGEIYPVEWESTAIAAGGDRSRQPHPEVATRCGPGLRAQLPAGRVTGRRPDRFRAEARHGAPVMARLYWDSQWLGDPLEWLGQRQARARLRHLRATGERLGLI